MAMYKICMERGSLLRTMAFDYGHGYAQEQYAMKREKTDKKDFFNHSAFSAITLFITSMQDTKKKNKRNRYMDINQIMKNTQIQTQK